MVGASMAGLCAARVLADRFDHVVVVDRDSLPDDATWRSQVPQGRHPHILHVPGARLLEGWFPGLTADLHDAGALDIDVSADLHWYQTGGVWRRPPTALRGPAMSRPLLEHAVRRRLATIANVDIRGGVAVDGVETDRSGQRITGVQLSGEQAESCELVVDATGRQARSLRWLTELGFDPPPLSQVEVDTRYVTAVYRRTDAPARDWEAAAVIDEPPTRRIAMAVPFEGDRWFVLFGGINGESPPTEPAAALAYARTLPSPVIAQVLECSESLGEAVTHRFPANQRRHVERMRRFPLGWILLGDAVCSFNPIYGQGMTVAAQQAVALGAQLDRCGALDRSFSRRYFRAAGRTVATPWSIAVGGDFAYAATKGRKPAGTDLTNRYMDKVSVAAQHDDTVASRAAEVLAMARRPEWLLAPVFAARVLRGARRGPAGLPGAAATGAVKPSSEVPTAGVR